MCVVHVQARPSFLPTGMQRSHPRLDVADFDEDCITIEGEPSTGDYRPYRRSSSLNPQNLPSKMTSPVPSPTAYGGDPDNFDRPFKQKNFGNASVKSPIGRMNAWKTAVQHDDNDYGVRSDFENIISALIVNKKNPLLRKIKQNAKEESKNGLLLDPDKPNSKELMLRRRSRSLTGEEVAHVQKRWGKLQRFASSGRRGSQEIECSIQLAVTDSDGNVKTASKLEQEIEGHDDRHLDDKADKLSLIDEQNADARSSRRKPFTRALTVHHDDDFDLETGQEDSRSIVDEHPPIESVRFKCHILPYMHPSPAAAS